MGWPGAVLTPSPSGIRGCWLSPVIGAGSGAGRHPPVGGGSTRRGRARRLYLVLDSVVQVGPASCGPELGAQEGPEYWDSAEEELTAAQATARIIAGEDGLRGLIQGLVWGIRRQNSQQQPRPLPKWPPLHLLPRAYPDLIIKCLNPGTRVKAAGVATVFQELRTQALWSTSGNFPDAHTWGLRPQ